MNVGQVVFLAELAQPVGDAVGVHPASIILCENVAAVHPTVSLQKFQPQLLIFPPAQEVKTLGGKVDGTNSPVLGFSFINAFGFC